MGNGQWTAADSKGEPLSRRSYMDNLKKWGVRKYKRKVMVHDQAGGTQDAAEDDRRCPGTASSSASRVPEGHDVLQPPHGGQAGFHDPGWGLLAQGDWPADGASLSTYAALCVADDAPQ